MQCWSLIMILGPSVTTTYVRNSMYFRQQPWVGSISSHVRSVILGPSLNHKATCRLQFWFSCLDLAIHDSPADDMSSAPNLLLCFPPVFHCTKYLLLFLWFFQFWILINLFLCFSHFISLLGKKKQEYFSCYLCHIESECNQSLFFSYLR